MARLESAVTIHRRIEDVFAFLLNLDRNFTDPTVESVTKMPEGPTGPGTTFVFQHGKGRETSMEYTAVEPDQRIGFVGKVGPLRPEGEWHFSDEGGKTRLSVSVAANPVGPLRLFSPLINRMGQKIWDKRLSAIKDKLVSSM